MYVCINIINGWPINGVQLAIINVYMAWRGGGLQLAWRRSNGVLLCGYWHVYLMACVHVAACINVAWLLCVAWRISYCVLLMCD